MNYFLDHLKNLLFIIKIDLAKLQGQDERIIPFEEHNRFSSMPMFDIIGHCSTQSIIDIRELQFEHCLHSNHRKEVYSPKIIPFPTPYYL